MNVRSIAAYRRTQRSQVCSLAYWLAATWRRPTFAQMTQSELSHMAGAVDDGTINIVLGIRIILVFFRIFCLTRFVVCEFSTQSLNNIR